MSREQLRTERLLLRPVESADALFLVQLHQNPELVRFIPSAALQSLEEAQALVPRLRSLVDDPVLGHWLVTLHDGTGVGMVMFKPIPASQGVERRDVEIGWRQVAEQCGHGYITEAARAVLDHAHAHGVERVVAVTDPANTASQNVCRRLGMRALGRSRDYYDTETELFEHVAGLPGGGSTTDPGQPAVVPGP